MLARKAWIQLATKAGIGVGALCIVGVLLAAIPNHRPPAAGIVSAEAGQDPQGTDHSKMPGMNMDAEDAAASEPGAMHDMEHMHHGDTPHMHMTAPRPQNAGDQKRAVEIVEQLRSVIDIYKYYHVALNDGF